MRKLLALTGGDIKNILRDNTLVLVLFGPVALFLILKFGVPFGSKLLLQHFQFQLEPYYLLIVCFMGLVPSMLFGLVSGLLILDERDEEIIDWFAVTPVQRSGYLAYKLGSSVFLGGISFLIIVYFSGLIQISFAYSIFIALLVALEAPIVSLILAAFANNKVEGLAYSKATGFMFLAPLIVFLVPSNWNYLTGFLPPFWVAKAFIAAQMESGIFWLYILVGLIVHIGINFYLMKRFEIRQH